jgi:hypothetical protein
MKFAGLIVVGGGLVQRLPAISSSVRCDGHAPTVILADGNPIPNWFGRCNDLCDGVGRFVTAA